MSKLIILAYSGGLDTSAILPWLKEEMDADVVAYCCDVGNLPDQHVLEKRALELGASRVVFEDMKDVFARDYVYPLIRAGATYHEDYLLGTAIARPLIAERVAILAKSLGADAIAHGATGKGNDQIRFERAWAYLAPELSVIAPWRKWNFKSRTDLVKYLADKGFDFDCEVNPKYSVDANLMHRSCEGGELEDLGVCYDKSIVLEMVKANIQSGTGQGVDILFEQGIPVTLNEERMSPAALLERLNQIGGANGIGIADLVEERINGIKSRGIYETPGGTILHYASRSLKQICWSRDLLQLSLRVAQTYGELVYDGLWHSDAREALEAYFIRAANSLNGHVELEIISGQMFIKKRSSPHTLYDKDLVSFEDDIFDINKSADGYLNILNLSQRRAGLAIASQKNDGQAQDGQAGSG